MLHQTIWFIRIHFNPIESIFEFIWYNLNPFESNWIHLNPFDAIWYHLNSIDCKWSQLILYSCFILRSLYLSMLFFNRDQRSIAVLKITNHQCRTFDVPFLKLFETFPNCCIRNIFETFQMYASFSKNFKSFWYFPNHEISKVSFLSGRRQPFYINHCNKKLSDRGFEGTTGCGLLHATSSTSR